MNAPEVKTALKTARPALVASSHPNGGMLFTGGVPGNRGGTGRPPSVLRERLRGSFADRVNVLEEIADDPAMQTGDRIRAIDLMGKYGLGVTREVSLHEVQAKLQTTVNLIRETLASEVAEPLLNRLRAVWTAA